MGLFNKKPKVVKEIHGGAWGHLVSEHHIDVDTLSRDIRCVERTGQLEGWKSAVTFMRVFSLHEVTERGVEVTGWDTFDQHPELLLFEGYLRPDNRAFLQKKRDSKNIVSKS